MLPREKNGVVDPTLKVYGTTNLRVVDLSIVPLHVSAHTQGNIDLLYDGRWTGAHLVQIATAYAIGEKGEVFLC